MFGFLMSQIMCKLVTKRFYRAFGMRGTDHQAQIILRRRLRDQEYIGSNRRGGPYGTAKNILYPNHAGATHVDQDNVINRGKSRYSGVAGDAIRSNPGPVQLGSECVAD